MVLSGTCHQAQEGTHTYHQMSQTKDTDTINLQEDFPVLDHHLDHRLVSQQDLQGHQHLRFPRVHQQDLHLSQHLDQGLHQASQLQDQGPAQVEVTQHQDPDRLLDSQLVQVLIILALV